MDRATQLEYALLLMVAQYCNDGGLLNNQCMSAGEEAFETLGLRNWESISVVHQRIEELERSQQT